MSRRKAWKADGRQMIREDRVKVSTMAQFSEMLKLLHITVQHLAGQPPKCSSRTGTGIGRAAVAWDRPDKHCACSKCMCKAHIEADAFECDWGLEVTSIFDLFETSRFENFQRKYRGR